MISIHDDSLKRVQTLPGLFEAMTQDPDDVKYKNGGMYPVIIPEDPEARIHVVKTLFSLFRAGLVKLGQTENKHLSVLVSGNYHVIPGAGEAHVSDERIMQSDLGMILSAFTPIIPPPEDPSFPDALRNRVVGLIRLLGNTHNFHRHGKDTGATVRAAAQLARPTDDGRLIRDVPWEGDNGRLEILSKRANSMEQAGKIPALRADNVRLYGLLAELYTPLNLYFHLGDVFNAFGETVSKLALDPYFEAQFRNVLCKKLQKVDSTQIAAEIAKLGALAAGFRLASKIQEFKQKIDAFNPLAS